MLKLALLAPAVASLSPPFEEWMVKHGRAYATREEQALRKAVYEENVKYIDQHNAKQLPWTLSANMFADLSNQEFRSRYASGLAREAGVNPPEELVAPIPAGDLPQSVDWVSAGAVTPVKNQGQCGSCWSFSATGAMEGINAIKTGKLVSLSEQQLIDCSTAYGNEGCNGGEMDAAMKYAANSAGMCSEQEYPYVDAMGGNDDNGLGVCQALPHNGTAGCKPVATISGYLYVTPNNTQAMMAAVAQQPVSIGVEADTDIQFYFGGVITDVNCGYNLDHGVLAVGYGTTNVTIFNTTVQYDYFKVKNSWGAFWGVDWGYMLLGRQGPLNPTIPDQGICGMNIQGIIPTKD